MPLAPARRRPLALALSQLLPAHHLNEFVRARRWVGSSALGGANSNIAAAGVRLYQKCFRASSP